MDLSLKEAARMLDKSQRQLRYMIHNGELPAKKVRERWRIKREDLPLTDGQARAHERKLSQVSRMVDSVLQSPSKKKKHYSVLDLKVFQVGKNLFRHVIEGLTEDHAAGQALRESLVLIGNGCHAYDVRQKQSAYLRAREMASRAVVLLFLDENKSTTAMAQTLETEYLAALAGLIRRTEEKGKR